MDVNIGPRERARRRTLGAWALAIGLAASLIVPLVGLPRWTRLAVFFPLWTAALGLIQAREKVCVSLAARGVCNMDSGEEPVEDIVRKTRLRRKAVSIHLRAFAYAAVGAVAAYELPLH